MTGTPYVAMTTEPPGMLNVPLYLNMFHLQISMTIKSNPVLSHFPI